MNNELFYKALQKKNRTTDQVCPNPHLCPLG